ncbi:hypothetical protein DERP_003175 [Dermatophagoides pteronyssinus]|uniref:Beta-alanine-activating enzyme-like n=1 Tax=Dermatophagoides pteronyssinus TaxID=6956 RepID=A0ABQ8JIT1_DERPT|nr:hypothetical protein DERP_003175 [Dermatophagoides pteronyssinus]
MDRDDNILNILLNKKFIQLLDQNDDDHNDVVENSFLLSKSAISYIDFDANVQTISYQKLLDYCRQIRKRLIESLELNDIKPIKILENVSIDNCEKISIKIPQTLVIYGDCGLWTPIFMLIANIMKLSFYYVSDQEILVKNIEQFKSLSLLTGILITHRYRSQELEQILNSSTDDEFIIDNIIDDFFIFLKKSSPIDNHHDDDIDKEFQSINISYLINTSGTTTSINRISNNTNNSNVVVSNKTIFVTHSSIQRNVIDFCNEFNLIADDIVLICSSFSFDPSICDMFLALSSFSHLIITDNSVRNVGENFAKIISEFEITYMTITPSLWYRINYYLLKIFQKSSSSSIHLRFVNFGGEICPNQNQLKIFQQYPIEFRNLYGLSEMSVWASMFKIDGISSVDQEIPIMGRSLIDTNVSLDQYNEIILESNVRKCLIFESNNIEWSWYSRLMTNDFGIQIDNNLYFDRRKSFENFIKLNGIKCHLRAIEQSLIQEFGKPDDDHNDFFIQNILIKEDEWQNNLRFLEIITTICSTKPDQYDNDNIKQKIATFIRKFYPKIAFRIHLIDSSRIVCLNTNSKLDISKLYQNIDPNQIPTLSNDLICNEIKSIISKILHSTEIATDKPLNSYGIDSMMAVEITTSIENFFSLYNENIYPLLFTHTIDQLVDVIINMIEIRKFNNKKQRTSKRYVDRIKSFDTIVLISNSSFRIEHLWSYFMEQCVDSSPLLIHLDSMTTMIICTSHSGLINTFVENIEQKNYYSIRWSQKIPNRIEANPIASSDCELVYVADYSGLIQAFDLKSGRIVWQSKTNDQIKCSPIIFTDSSIGELILCGSYDHNLYCWQQSNGYIRWKIDVNQSPIFASPVVWYDQLGNNWFAVVCTLNGTIGCYHLIDGQQRWKYNHSNRPIFSTPKIFKDNLIVGMTDSRLISISLQNGLIIWELLLEKMPIFSSPCLVKQNDNDDDCRIIIGTNGCSIMCTKFNSKQPEWIFKTESNVYADIIYLTEFERLLAIETNGKIHLLNPNDGQSIPINGFDHFNAEIFSSPVYNVNRKTFLIGCRDSYVHCLSLKESV